MIQFAKRLGGEFMSHNNRDSEINRAWLRGGDGAAQTCRKNFGMVIAQMRARRCQSPSQFM